jgi:uncharacterized lipoprotein YajG
MANGITKNKIIWLVFILLFVASILMGETKIVNEPIVVTKPQKVNADSTVNVVAQDDIQRLVSDLRKENQAQDNRIKLLEQKVETLEKNQGG